MTELLTGMAQWIRLYRARLGFLSQRLRFWLFSKWHRLTYRPHKDVKNIVVLGASFCGYEIAKVLANAVPSAYRVVIVEKNSHVNCVWHLPHHCALPGHEEDVFVPFGGYLGHPPAKSYVWKHAKAESIELSHETRANSSRPGVVVLDTGERVPFEYLAVALGSSASLPSRIGVRDKEGGLRAIRAVQDKVKNAQNVVVLGGGAAGVETAADVKEVYPDKTVSLVHSRSALLHYMGKTLQEQSLRDLRDMGVEVYLEERPDVTDAEAKGFIELKKSGKTIKCDLMLSCAGQRANSDIIAQISPESISASGHIRVKPTLQLADARFPNIFAAGDIIESDVTKNGRSAFNQAGVASGNILRMIRGRPLQSYEPVWWENSIALTMGLVSGYQDVPQLTHQHKVYFHVNDGKNETCQPSPLDLRQETARFWAYMGAKRD